MILNWCTTWSKRLILKEKTISFSQTHLDYWYKRVNLRIETQTLLTIDRRRGGQEEVVKDIGKRKRTRKRIALRSVIRLSTRLRCARTGLSLMVNSADTATNANLLMVILRGICQLRLFTLSINPRIALSFTMNLKSHVPMAFVASSYMRSAHLRKYINFTMCTSSMR